MLQDNAVRMGRGSSSTTIIGNLQEAIILETQKFNSIAALWHAIFEYYPNSQAPSPQQLRWYTEDMMPYEVEEVEEAMLVWRRSPVQKGHNPKPPVPAQLVAIICPETDIDGEANRLAHELWGNIATIGRNATKKAELACGPAVWSAVQRHGGWSNLCEANMSEVHRFIPQWRDYIKPLLEKEGTEAQKRLRAEARAFLGERREARAGAAVAHIGQMVKKIAPSKGSDVQRSDH